MADEMKSGVDGTVPKQPVSVPEADVLVSTLTSLVRRIPSAGGADPSGKESATGVPGRRPGRPDPAFKLALITVASRARSALRAGDLRTAAIIIGRLRQALDGGWSEIASSGLVDEIRRALARFDVAERTVDRQIGQLRAVLRRSDDPRFRGFSECGLNGLTGGTWAKLQATITELRASLPIVDAGLAATACQLAEEVAVLFSESETVQACDNNSFGVPVTIAATLGGAARRLHEVLRKVGRR